MTERTRIKDNQYSRIFIYFGLAVLLYLFDIVGILSPFHTISDTIFNPVKGLIFANVKTWRDFVTASFAYSSIKSELTRLDLLQKRVLELEQETQELSEENSKLREILEAPIPSAWKVLPNSVLGITRTMTISAGAKDGIAEGMTVIDGPYFVGRVLSVNQKSAQVRLPNDSEIEILAKTSRDTRGIVRGVFGEKMELQQVLQSDELFLEDRVLTTGEDGLAPGLLLGTVDEIESREADPYKKAILKPAVDFRRLSTVFVVLEM